MLDGLAIFKDVKRKGWDEVKSKKKYTGDDFHKQVIFKVCTLDVIDTSIKRKGDALSAFQKTCSTLAKDL